EMVAVDLILGQQEGEPRPDVVLSIVDASNLERNLYLTTQVVELGVPVVVALNMIDVAEAQGIRIDTERLSRQFGVPGVPIQGNKGGGLARLRSAMGDCGLRFADWSGQSAIRNPQSAIPRVPFPDAFEKEVHQLHDHMSGNVPPFLVRRLLLDVGGYTE